MNKAEFLKKWIPEAEKMTHIIGINYMYIAMGDDLDELVHSVMGKEEEKPLNPLQEFLNYWTAKHDWITNDSTRREEFIRATRYLVSWAREEGAKEYRDRMSEGKVLESNANDVGSDGTFWIPTARLRYVRYNVKEVLQQEWKNLGGYPNIKKEWRDVVVQNG
jgi:hypothetical protein